MYIIYRSCQQIEIIARPARDLPKDKKNNKKNGINSAWARSKTGGVINQ